VVVVWGGGGGGGGGVKCVLVHSIVINILLGEGQWE